MSFFKTDRRESCWIVAALVAALVPTVDPARAQDQRLEGVKEAFAMQAGDLLKNIPFSRAHADVCPQFTALLSSAGTRVRLLTPYHGLPSETVPYIARSSDANAVELRFERSQCRHVLTVKRFNGGGPTGEIEVPLRPRQLDYPPPTVSQADVVYPGNISNRYAYDRVGDFSQLTVQFDAATEFSFAGAISFAPGNLAVYLVNAPEELSLVARKNGERRAFDISISNQRSRVYMAVTRELNVDGAWTRLFDE